MPKPNKHLDTFKDQHLLLGEEVVAWAPAIREGRGFEGVGILTNQRVVFIRKGFTSTKFEPWPLGKITSVEVNKGMIFYDATLHTSGDELTLQMSEKERAQRLIDALQERLNAPSAAAASTAAGATTPPPADPVEQLEKLAKLRDMGAIDESEFDKKKRELLAKI